MAMLPGWKEQKLALMHMAKDHRKPTDIFWDGMDKIKWGNGKPKTTEKVTHGAVEITRITFK